MVQSGSRIEGNLNWNGLQKPQFFVAVVAILTGLFLSVMDGTVCNVALPALAADLHISDSDSIWIVNSFQLVIVMLLLPFASLGELYGHRKVYIYGLLIFIIGSLSCALSPSFEFLVVSRILQGVGAAMEMSVSTSLIKLIYPKEQLGKGLALNATIVALALVIGPTITGAVLSFANWPWLFLINVPIGLIALVLSHKSLPDNPTRIAGRKFDIKEAILNALSFGLIIGSFEAISHGADKWIALSGLLLSILVVTFYIKNQQKKEFPMFPLDLMRNSVFSISLCTSIISFASQMVLMVGMPFLLTNTYHFDVSEIGLLMTVYPIVILFATPLSGQLINKVNPSILCSIGLVFMCISNFLLASMPADEGFWDIAWKLALGGIGFGFFQSPNNHMLISSAPNHRAGAASGMLALARLVGQTAGAACVALFLQSLGNIGPIRSMLLGGIFSIIALLLSLYLVFRNRQK